MLIPSTVVGIVVADVGNSVGAVNESTEIQNNI